MTTQTTIKERPILFSGAMVRAILSGAKTQTRRNVNPQPVPGCTRFERAPFKGYGKPGYWIQMTPDESTQLGLGCDRFGVAGDRLWVRETFSQPGGCMHYFADDNDDHSEVYHWKPSIFMRRHESRLTLEVLAVRIERLQDISETDAIAEGVRTLPAPQWRPAGWRETYLQLWDDINGRDSAAKNPWVWVVEFKRV